MSRSMRRFLVSKGRYLARWPSYKEFSEMHGDEIEPDLEPAGIREIQDGDQRVINFAKTVRLSKNTKSPYFWKELATSAGNLFVRIVGDVKALFSSVFAEDPDWDGACTSLQSVFKVRKNVDLNTIKKHPWASQSTKSANRVKFA